MESKYQNSKIYKITNNVNDKLYIGSTIQDLKDRFRCHKKDYKRYLNDKYHYVSSFYLFNNYGIDNCKIDLIELYDCNNKKDLEKREGYYIKKNKENCINKNIAARTKKEYYNDNKQAMNEKSKIYYANNQDQIKEKNKIYRENNKDQIKEQKKQIFECVCGCSYTYSHKARHFKSLKHKKYIENLKPIIINNYNIEKVENLSIITNNK